MEVNMKLSKRILSAFLAILMVCSIAATVSAANVTFTDVSGHWAANQIQYLVDKGVLNGYKQPIIFADSVDVGTIVSYVAYKQSEV